MKYQIGQQFLVRVNPTDNLAFRLRIRAINNDGTYTVQQIANVNIQSVDETTLEQWIKNVDKR